MLYKCNYTNMYQNVRKRDFDRLHFFYGFVKI